MKANNHKKLNKAYNDFLESRNEYTKAFRINPDSYDTHMWEDFLLLSEKTLHEVLEAVLEDENPKRKAAGCSVAAG